MKKLKLTRGQYTIVDDEDFIELSKNKWRTATGALIPYVFRTKKNPNGKKETIMMHRFIMNAPKGKQVDHKNRNVFDNRRSNLRICTPSENLRNRGIRRDNTSGFKGVHWNRILSMWQTKIKFNKKSIHLGCYKDIVDAAKAYNEAALKYHGDFASLNEL